MAAGLTDEPLWVEAAAVLTAGLLAIGIVGERSPSAAVVPSIRGSLVGRPDVLYGWIARGTGSLTWFAFPLGLSVIGAERGQPGVYLAAGMSGYGAGSVAGLAALSGLTLVLGIAAISVIITRSSAGAERRALLSGQAVVVNASASAGMLVGGPVIAAAGAGNTLIGSGLLTATVALGVLGVRIKQRKRGCLRERSLRHCRPRW